MVQFVSREEWNARPSKSTIPTTTWGKRTGFVVHHTAADDDQKVRDIQNYHMTSDQLADGGWKDIGYNFLIDKQGRIYEGVGWTKIGAHVAGHNTANIGVCMIGNFQNALPTDAAMDALRWLYAEANKRKKSKLALYGHRQLGSTACPGNKLYAVLEGNGLADKPTPTKPQQPKPSEPKESWTDKLMSDLPETKKGAKGLPVNRIQALANIRGAKLREDGHFGDITEREVKEFQRATGLVDDGIVGPKTWHKLLTWKW